MHYEIRIYDAPDSDEPTRADLDSHVAGSDPRDVHTYESIEAVARAIQEWSGPATATIYAVEGGEERELDTYEGARLEELTATERLDDDPQ